MKKTTAKILAGILAAASAVSLASCSSDEQSGSADATTTAKTEWTGDNVEVTAAEDVIDNELDISGQSLKWMGIYDLNPTNDTPERETQVALFEDVYGAKIEYIPTTTTTQFDDLATSIIGGTPPDVFIFSERTFPYDINKGQFQPIDSIVDWEDPMWADVKDQADMFLWNGEHYVAPFGYGANDFQILMYNRSELERLGLEDPYTLYEEDKWDWDAFVSIMKDFVEAGEGDRYGIGGWWANAFVYTSGDPLVKYDGKTFTNNLYSAPVERAQFTMENIWKSDMVKRGWIDPAAAFINGDLLFYSMGTWAVNSASEAVGDDEVFIVPFPKEPETDTYYMHKSIFSHMWVKGSENKDVVKAWFNVNRLVFYDDQYIQVTKDKFLKNNSNWSEEAYDVMLSYYDDDKFKLAYDYGFGLSADMNTTVMPTLYEGIVNENFESWTQAREEYSNIVDSEIAAYN